MARPRKDTDAARAKILEALRAGCTRGAAAAAAGVTGQTLSNWCDRYLSFFNECAIAEKLAEMRFTLVLTKAAQDGDAKYALEWLKRRNRNEWGDNIAVAADRRIEEALAALFPEEAGGGSAEAESSTGAEDEGQGDS